MMSAGMDSWKAGEGFCGEGDDQSTQGKGGETDPNKGEQSYRIFSRDGIFPSGKRALSDRAFSSGNYTGSRERCLSSPLDL